MCQLQIQAHQRDQSRIRCQLFLLLKVMKSFNSIANIGDGNCKQERGPLIPEKEKIDLKSVHDKNMLLEQ